MILKNKLTQGFFTTTIFFLLALGKETYSVKLDPNGGYHLTIAVGLGTNQPSDVGDYLESIKTQLNEFSKLLFTTTDGRFFVKSSNVILPYHWDVEEADGGEKETAIIDNYNNADIRLSRSIEAPHVENPNKCGLPGEYIELPLTFFQNVSAGYGLPSKALLASWARYRWGTWEEHGYPGDHRFPYFYKSPGNSSWVATGCSDVDLRGEIKDRQNNTCNSTHEVYPPGGACRFIPEDQQVAKSSLAYFHWLESVTSFCDEETHNPDAPNKQNLYCNYQSITQVIVQSPDGLAATTTESELPALNFKISYENRKPLFYLLVDGSRFRAPDLLYDSVMNETMKLFGFENIEEIPAKAAVFPPTTLLPSDGFTTSNLQEIVPWGYVSKQRAEFEKAVNYFRTGASQPGIFNAAIKDIIEELSSIGNPAGAVILVLKHGAGAGVFDSEVYESEIILRMKQEKIMLHALEISGTNIDPKLHLERIASESGGSYLALSPRLSMTPTLIRKIATSFENSVTPNKTQETIFKGYLKRLDQFTIPLGAADLPEGTWIKFEVTASRNVDSSTNLISIVEGKGEGQLTMLSDYFEYNDTTSGINRKVLTYKLSYPVDTLIDVFTFEYGGVDECLNCVAWVVATVHYPPDYIFPEEVHSFEVTTSETDLDIGNHRPLEIFAKITQNGQPIVGVTEVRATLHSYGRRESYESVLLKDDGANSGDITSNDGIYSGSILPAEDGLYFVTLSVKAVKPEVNYLEGVIHKDSAVQRLLPVNQNTVGCASNAKGCAVTVVDRAAVKFEQMASLVSVRNRAAFVPQSGRILDLDVEALDGYQVRLTWTVPAVFGSGTPVRPKELRGTASSKANSTSEEFVYEIHSSTSAEDLRSDSGFQNAHRHEPSAKDEISYEIGAKCSVTLLLESTELTFFAVRLSHVPTQDDHTPPSNVQGVTPAENPVTTTTTTTTLAPPTTTTTTRRTTTTTPAPHTGSTEITTESSSTTEPEYKSKYWFETTEGTVTLSVFGAGVLVLIVGLIVFRGITLRRTSAAKQTARKEAGP